MYIKWETLQLDRYSEDKYKRLKDELENGISSSQYIHQVGQRLEMSQNNDSSLYQSAFVILDDDVPVGYLYISSMINDEVYLEYAILKDYRGMGYASDIVREISDYLFQNYNIRSIKLDIDPSNKSSIMVAHACGFMLDDEEYESRNFTGKMKFIKESNCYLSKRRK